MPAPSTPFTEARTVEYPILKWLRIGQQAELWEGVL